MKNTKNKTQKTNKQYRQESYNLLTKSALNRLKRYILCIEQYATDDNFQDIHLNMFNAVYMAEDDLRRQLRRLQEKR